MNRCKDLRWVFVNLRSNKQVVILYSKAFLTQGNELDRETKSCRKWGRQFGVPVDTVTTHGLPFQCNNQNKSHYWLSFAIHLPVVNWPQHYTVQNDWPTTSKSISVMGKNRSSPTTKAALFKDCVVQSFPLEMISALWEAVCGANEHGADMNRKLGIYWGQNVNLKFLKVLLNTARKNLLKLCFLQLLSDASSSFLNTFSSEHLSFVAKSALLSQKVVIEFVTCELPLEVVNGFVNCIEYICLQR